MRNARLNGRDRLVAGRQGQREHRRVVLVGVGQRVADLRHPVVVQQRVEIAKAELAVDQGTEAILWYFEVVGERPDGEPHAPVHPLGLEGGSNPRDVGRVPTDVSRRRHGCRPHGIDEQHRVGTEEQQHDGSGHQQADGRDAGMHREEDVGGECPELHGKALDEESQHDLGDRNHHEHDPGLPARLHPGRLRIRAASRRARTRASRPAAPTGRPRRAGRPAIGRASSHAGVTIHSSGSSSSICTVQATSR